MCQVGRRDELVAGLATFVLSDRFVAHAAHAGTTADNASERYDMFTGLLFLPAQYGKLYVLYPVFPWLSLCFCGCALGCACRWSCAYAWGCDCALGLRWRCSGSAHRGRGQLVLYFTRRRGTGARAVHTRRHTAQRRRTDPPRGKRCRSPLGANLDFAESGAFSSVATPPMYTTTLRVLGGSR